MKNIIYNFLFISYHKICQILFIIKQIIKWIIYKFFIKHIIGFVCLAYMCLIVALYILSRMYNFPAIPDSWRASFFAGIIFALPIYYRTKHNQEKMKEHDNKIK